MSLALTFETLIEYDPAAAGISVPIVLSLGLARLDLWAKLDTGSTYCVFEREIGEGLGLAVEGGQEEWIGTATGRFKAYGHDLTLFAFGFQLDLTAYFAEQMGFGRNVLGRYGLLQQLKLGLVDYEGKLYVGRYNDAM
jgi:hypothetical protein